MSFEIITDIPTILERGYENLDARYRNYQVLQNITFCDEPVVPKILGGKTIDHLGIITYQTEKLAGRDLSIYVGDPRIFLEKKLLAIRQVAMQLVTIDEAGYVLFDRHGSNIMVLDGPKPVPSVRQIDPKYLYDKRTHSLSVGSFLDLNRYKEMVDSIISRRGLNLWSYTIRNLAIELETARNNSPLSQSVSAIDMYITSLKDQKRFPTIEDVVDRLDLILHAELGNELIPVSTWQ